MSDELTSLIQDVTTEMKKTEEGQKQLEQLTTKGIELSTVLKGISENPKYLRQNARVRKNAGIREVRKELKVIRQEQYKAELMVVEGYYLGGNDWKNSKTGTIDKQKIAVATADGIKQLGVFGHAPSKDVPMEFMKKYSFKFSRFTTTNKVDYDTAKFHVEVEGSKEELLEWLAPDVIRPFDVEKSDLYTYVVLNAKVRGIAPQPIYGVTEDSETVKVKDKGGKQLFNEDGTEKTKKKATIVGYRDIISETEDAHHDDHFVGKFRCDVDNEGSSEPNMLEVNFYNQRLGRTRFEAENFQQEDNYNDIMDLEPTESAEFVTDLYAGEYVNVIAQITKYNTSEKEGIKTNWITATGYAIIDAQDYPQPEVSEEEVIEKNTDLTTGIIASTKSPQFMLIAGMDGKTTFSELESNGFFKTPEVMDIFGGKRITAETEGLYNKVLANLKKLEGDI